MTAALRRPGALVWTLLALALAVRLAGVAVVDFKAVDDPADYDRMAASIAAGDGYPPSNFLENGGPSAIRPPLYPYTLAAVYETTGARFNAARVTGAFLGTAAVALIGLVAWRLFDRRTATVAIAIAALFPPPMVNGLSILSEPLFVVLELGALLAALEFRESAQRRWLVATGVLVGLATLTRVVGLVLLVPVIALVWRTAFPGARSFASPAIVVVTAALTILPWTVRNAVELDAFVPVATTGGYLMAGTYQDAARNDPEYPGAWRVANADPKLARIMREGNGDEAEIERRLWSEALEYMGDHPLYVAEVGGRNTLRLFELEGREWNRLSTASIGLPTWVADAGFFGFWLLVPFVLVGAFTRAARAVPLAIWAFPLVCVAAAAFTEAFTRLRAPIDPFLVILASLGAIALWDRYRGNWRSRSMRQHAR